MKRLFALVLSIVALDAAAKAPVQCAPAATAQAEVVKTQESLIAALKAEDEAAFKTLIADSFYAYDAGKRLDSAAFVGMIKSVHATGKKYDWSVTEPEVHVQCDWAWMTYVNKGSITDTSGRQEVSWLESAIFHYEGGHWRIQFLHSSRRT